MDISLTIHLGIHFLLAVLSGYLIGKYFDTKILGILSGIIGGFLIDLDHVLEYLIVFRGHFNFQYFFEGRQFLLSEKLHLYFHAWELIPVFLLIAYFYRNNKLIKIIAIAIAFSGAVHLTSDVAINRVPLKFYSFIYRASNGFEMKNLMTPAIYKVNQDLKKELGI